MQKWLVLLTVLTWMGFVLAARSSVTTVRGDGVRAYEEFRVVPVRIHLLHSAEASAVNTRLKANDIARITRKANDIWHAAGFHLWVESVVEEKAANAEARKDDVALTLDSMLPLRPSGTRADGMFHVYYVSAMSVNGVYMARDAIFVQDMAGLREVPGGIDEPLPRVTSHELGHAMGLPHRQDRTNLMASGTTGISLNEAEIEKVRHTTDAIRWILPVEKFLKETDILAASGKAEEAVSRYHALLDIPGGSNIKDRAGAGLRRAGK